MDWVENIAEKMFDVITGLFTTSLSEGAFLAFTEITKLINSTAISFWDEPIITGLFGLSQKTCFIALVFSIPFLLSDIAQQVEDIDFKVVMMAVARAYIFSSVSGWGGTMIFKIAMLTTEALGVDIDASSIVEGKIFGSNSFGVLMMIIITIASMMFLCAAIGSCGAMFIHLMASPLYVPFILRGDKQKLDEWIATAVSIGVTYLIQYVSFYVAMFLYVRGNIIACFILISASLGAKAALKQFGYSGGGAGNGLISAARGAGVAAIGLMRGM